MVGIARATTPADRVFDVCNTLLLLVLAFLTLYPLYYVGIVSLSHGHAVIRGEVNWWPVGLNLESYRAVLEAPYVLGSFRNTVWYTFVGTAVNVSMSALCAYPLAMKFFYGRRFLTGFVVATMFFKSGLIPLYLMVRSLGMLDTIWALVLPTAVVTYYMIIMRTFFQNIPEELNDSAYLDGANDIQIFLRVVLPISTPILATMTLFYAVQHWNSFFPALIYLSDRERFPIQLILRAMVIEGDVANMQVEFQDDERIVDTTVKYAIIMVSTVPILLLYPFLQRYFVKGMMIGSLKG
ncbi:MAG: carbohydrate ABC transporter permease [Spirochaetaceae bacterium]|nr:carbohydrate ABC transporter permease [Spirochaetaceae bacterium]